MNFNTDKNKINKIINKQIDQSYIVGQSQSTDKKINDAYKKIEPTQASFKGCVTLYKNNWQLMQIADNFDPPLGDPWMGAQYLNWVIEFPRFDSRLIPFITVEILLRVAGGNIDDGITIRSLDKIHYFHIENIADTKNIVKLTVYACLNIDDQNVTMPYEAKVLISYSNPQNNV